MAKTILVRVAKRDIGYTKNPETGVMQKRWVGVRPALPEHIGVARYSTLHHRSRRERCGKADSSAPAQRAHHPTGKPHVSALLHSFEG